MTDRNDNPGGSNRSDESIENPDLGRDRDSGMGGYGSDRGSDVERDQDDLSDTGGSQRDRSRTDTSGDDLSDDRESGRSGSSGNGGFGSRNF